MSDATRRAALAERAARAGGVVAREAFRGDLAIDTKVDKNDFVTETDRDAQRQVIATVRQEFPEDAFVCEEDSEPPELAGSGGVEMLDSVPADRPTWVVDPIDGTANFVRGMRFWGTSVAAVVGGSPVGVATAMPATGDVYAAGPESATRNDESIAVSSRADLETFAVGLIGHWPVRDSARYADLFQAAAARFGDVRRLGSMQGVLALVADGGLDAAFAPTQPAPWDTVAGVHLIRRAGGTATDLEGDPWTQDSTSLVVSNGRAHDEVLDVVRSGLDPDARE